MWEWVCELSDCVSTFTHTHSQRNQQFCFLSRWEFHLSNALVAWLSRWINVPTGSVTEALHLLHTLRNKCRCSLLWWQVKLHKRNFLEFLPRYVWILWISLCLKSIGDQRCISVWAMLFPLQKGNDYSCQTFLIILLSGRQSLKTPRYMWSVISPSILLHDYATKTD